jgi:hypothetical protein
MSQVLAPTYTLPASSTAVTSRSVFAWSNGGKRCRAAFESAATKSMGTYCGSAAIQSRAARQSAHVA